MIEVPFWARSPSPFTIAFWILLALWGNLQIKGKVIYKRFPRLVGLTDSALVVGLVAFSFDAIWVFCQVCKFGQLYPADIPEMYRCLARDFLLFFLCLILVSYSLIKKKVIGMTKITVVLLFLEYAFFFIWFVLAPDPSWTDWTYAIRYGYSGSRVVEAFTISHTIGKFIQGLIFISLWRKDKVAS